MTPVPDAWTEADPTACRTCGRDSCEDPRHGEVPAQPDAAAVGPLDEDGDTGEGVRLQDFHAYMPAHNYLFAPSREFWPAASVNARVPPVPRIDSLGNAVLNQKGEPVLQQAHAWLDEHRAVEQLTWMPGEPMIVRNRLVSEGGWIERPGCATFNLYRPPSIVRGTAVLAEPWLDHVRTVYPNEHEHFLQWLAHRVQRPYEKINHGLVLGGAQGIGKDAALEPVKACVGPWNFIEVAPTHVLGRFNGFVKSVILRVSEARDLGDVDRFAFYDHTKTLTAAPPDVLRVDEKHLREYSVFNVCGVIITTNHKTNGLYLPADDRRHFVAWSERTKDDFPADYWSRLFSWYRAGGDQHVAAFLADLDLSAFDPKAPPPKTSAFWDIVDANRAPEDAELADALDQMGSPRAVTIAGIANKATPAFADWLRDRRSARQIPHRLESAGYVVVRNPNASDGLWKLGGSRRAVYVKRELSPHDRLAAVYEAGW